MCPACVQVSHSATSYIHPDAITAISRRTLDELRKENERLHADLKAIREKYLELSDEAKRLRILAQARFDNAQ